MSTVKSEQAKGLTLERKMMIMITTTTNYGSTTDACDYSMANPVFVVVMYKTQTFTPHYACGWFPAMH
jgi:hypothetical protein